MNPADPKALASPFFAHDVDLTVLVTCYNEREFILDTLEILTGALAEWGGSHEVLIVDDCSRDGSGELLEEYLSAHDLPQVRLIRNPVNKGLSRNFMDGAFLGRGKYYRLCCGDNAESREALVDIYRQIGKADLVIPYQVQSEVRGRSWRRRAISRLFTALVNLLSNNSIRYYNSLPVFLREHVIRFPPQSLGFGFQADIVTRLLEEDITYLQTRHLGPRENKGDASTALTLRNLLSVVHTFVEIAIRRLRRLLYGKGLRRAREIHTES
ncbi:MAG: glycosyltransferase family 2 protein [Proteobacteria bacterium]|nr:glycosyltransferase family 2 protein [Pseudomonadota bacterium]